MKPSFISRLLLWFLKLFVRRRIKPDMDVVGEREQLRRFEKYSKKLPPEISDNQAEFSTHYKCTRLTHRSTRQDRVILYLHGGGFMWEMPAMYKGFVGELCTRLGADAIIPWYRLAPEHPYPSGPEDCFDCYRALVETVSPDNIILIGDSAGGNLVLTTQLRARHAGLPMPRCSVLLSPVTDLAQQSSSWLLNGWHGKDPLFPRDAFSLLEHYCAGHDRTDPLLSPFYADFTGFSPMLFIAGETESLLEDSIGVAKKARANGVSTEMQVWRGMPHVFPVMDLLPEAKRAKGEIERFVNDQFSAIAADHKESVLIKQF